MQKNVNIKIKLDKDTKELVILKNDLKQLGGSFSKADSYANKLLKRLNMFGHITGLIYALDKATSIYIRTVDEMTASASRLQLVTDSYTELYATQNKLFALSQKTRASYTATSSLYTKLKQSTKGLNVSQSELFTVVKSVNEALVISGASAQESSSTILQLSQGLASGVLRGDEFNSVMENGNRVALALADGLGVTLGQLRQMSQEGKLTADVVLSALTQEAQTIDKEFSQMQATVSQAGTVAANSMKKFTYEVDQSLGLTKSLSKEITDFSKALDGIDVPKYSKEFADVAQTVAKVGAALALTAATMRTYTVVTTMAAASTTALGGSFNRLNVTIIAATVSTKAFSMATRSIPYVALAAGIYGLIEYFPKLTSETTLAQQAMNDYAKSVRDASNAQLDFEITKITKKLAQTSKLANDEARKRGAGAPVSGYGETLAYELTQLSQQLDILKKQKKAIQERKSITAKKDNTKPDKTINWDKVDMNPIAEAGYKIFQQYQEKKKKELQQQHAEQLAFEKQWAEIVMQDYQKEQEELRKKLALEKEWGNVLDENYKSALDYQIELAQSAMDWGDNLTGVAKQIGGISKALQSFHVAELKGTRAEQATYAKYAKQFVTFQDDRQKVMKLQKMQEKDIAKIREETRNAELRGFANLAGVMASSYKEGSDAAIAFTTVQSALGIASSWTAIAEAWALGFPQNLAAVATVAANVMPIIQQLGGSGSAGGAATPAPTRQETFDKKATDYENSVKPITDRLDRQIELLQAISGYGGTAVSNELKKAQETYNRQSVVDTLKAVGLMGQTKTYKAKKSGWKGVVYHSSREKLTLSAASVGSAAYEKALEKKYSEYVKGSYGRLSLNHSKTWGALQLNQSTQANASKYIEFLMKLKDNKDLANFGITNQEYKDIINQAEKTTHDFAMSVINSYQTIFDSGKSFKDDYDKLFGDYYKNKALAQAQADVNKLRGGQSLQSYLKDVITTIDSMKLTKAQIDLLQSENEKDLPAKIKLEKELSQQYGKNVEAALNYKDSIDLVAQSMGDNVKALNDAWLGQYSPLTMLQKTAYANSIANNVIPSTMSASEKALLALQQSQATATTDEQARAAFNRYVATLDAQVEDSSRTDIVNAIQTSNEKLDELIYKTEALAV